jgi:hypothetical protein
VVDRLRLFLNRPLRDADRPRLFAIAVAVIVATAGVLALFEDSGPAPEPALTKIEPPLAVVTDPPAAPPEPSPTATAPSEEGTPAPGSVASRADVARAKRVARRFLAGYLPYTYGRGSARSIEGATGQLRAQLTRERPRVPAREQSRQPRVVLVQSDGVSRSRARMLALVRDGRRRYGVPLELSRTRGAWRVTSAGA